MRKKIIISGFIVSVLSFGIYFIFFESKVNEWRITYSVDSAEYSEYESKMKRFYSKSSNHSILLIPNFSSLGDSLSDKGVRRFELKAFDSGISSYTPKDYAATYFFQKELGLTAPEVASNRFVSSSKPLKTSLGVALIVLCSFLLFDLLYFRLRNSNSE